MLVLGFLAVWTVRVLERGGLHTPLVTQGHTRTGRHFYLCHHDRWDYTMAVGESRSGTSSAFPRGPLA